VPELSRFYGIVIRMFEEQDAPHHRPHFHAIYGEYAGVFAIDSLELIAGRLPRRQRRLVEAWAELHHMELVEDWQRLQAGQSAHPIAPLR
jgi:hypothetical protein